MKKSNIFRYYYYGYIFRLDLSDFMSFDEAVEYAYDVHKKQCKEHNLIVDFRSKELIINNLKKLYNEKN